MATRTRIVGLTARRDVQVLALAVAVELLLLGLYLFTAPGQISRLRYTLYPFVWINAGAWAVFHTSAPTTSRRQSRPRRPGTGERWSARWCGRPPTRRR